MFYENERIINKQLKFVKTRAYDIIQDLETKGLGDKEIAACIGLLMTGETTEYQKDVLDYALRTVNSRQETSHAIQTIDTTYSWVDGRIQCKVPDIQPSEPVKVQPANQRKARKSNKNRKNN